ncbi:nucleotide-binding alpha-beta plait domain-containing protein [Artemisia annua]|uniref:Nucleotide-binding alpha-beta plait domain-containing protein n=1 Tax=Artemisia annua TaxID=35608 RepID=A0A2U1QKA0_ARTAN|nr:nucleotide-binding alpha-beta plait domain-containing protein [Artemisia annua]
MHFLMFLLSIAPSMMISKKPLLRKFDEKGNKRNYAATDGTQCQSCMHVSSSSSPLSSMSSTKLFVGGLAYATDEMGLKEAFQQYGEVDMTHYGCSNFSRQSYC